MANVYKIVMIDDEKDLCSVVKDNLEETGRFEVATLSDSNQAEQFVISQKPDVILLDVVMPGRQGPEIISAFKKNSELKTIPIIVVSGKGEMVYNRKKEEFKWMPNSPLVKARGDLPDVKGAEQLALAYGVEDYISKPFTTDILIMVIEDVLKKFRKIEDVQEEEL